MERVVRYGIIGVGLMGIEHIENLLLIPGAQITAIADTCPTSLSSALKVISKKTQSSSSTNYSANKSIKVFNEASALLKTRNLIDIVIISTPNNNHIKILRDILYYADKNLHIFIEKPLCTTINDCRFVIKNFDQVSSWNGLIWVGMEYRYMRPISKIISFIKEDKIGQVKLSSIREHRFPFLKKVNDWNRFNKNTGGTLVEKCCHFWDLFNQFLKPSFPVKVTASGSQAVNHLDERYDGNIPDIMDHAFVIVEYSCGARVMLDLCMFAESSMHQEEVVVVGPKGKLEAFIPQNEFRYGKRGVHGLGKVHVEIVKDDSVRFEGYHSGASFLEHLDLIQWIRNNGDTKGLKQKPVTLWDGFMAVAVGIAAHRSIDEGRWVRMDEVITQEELEGKLPPK